MKTVSRFRWVRAFVAWVVRASPAIIQKHKFGLKISYSGYIALNPTSTYNMNNYDEITKLRLSYITHADIQTSLCNTECKIIWCRDIRSEFRSVHNLFIMQQSSYEFTENDPVYLLLLYTNTENYLLFIKIKRKNFCASFFSVVYG